MNSTRSQDEGLRIRKKSCRALPLEGPGSSCRKDHVCDLVGKRRGREMHLCQGLYLLSKLLVTGFLVRAGEIWLKEVKA